MNNEIHTAYGVDVRLEYAKTECLKNYKSSLIDDPIPTGRLLGQLNIPPIKGILQKLPENCPYPWVEFYKLNGVIGRQYGKMVFTNAEIVSFLASGNSKNEIQGRFYEPQIGLQKIQLGQRNFNSGLISW